MIQTLKGREASTEKTSKPATLILVMLTVNTNTLN